LILIFVLLLSGIGFLNNLDPFSYVKMNPLMFTLLLLFGFLCIQIDGELKHPFFSEIVVPSKENDSVVGSMFGEAQALQG
jgi:hypothetical protein